MKPIAEKPAELPEIHCVQEVRLEVPLERLAELQEFYAELLGLTPWPPREQIPGGWGVGNPLRGLYLQFRHDSRIDPVRRRFTLLVASLPEVIGRLTEHDWPFDHCHGFGTDESLIVADPVGHLVEIRASHRSL